MSRQELYSWASILSSVAFIGLYLVLMFGVPTIIEPIRENLIQALILVIFVDIVVQSIITSQKKKAGGVDRDERDDRIEAKGFKTAYYVFVVSIVLLMGQMFVMKMLGTWADPDYLSTMRELSLHYLVVVFFVGTIAKSMTQVILYRKGA